MWGWVPKHLRTSEVLTPHRSPPPSFPHAPCKCQALHVPGDGYLRKVGTQPLQPGLHLPRWGSTSAAACEVKASTVTKSLLVSFLMF